MSWFRKHESNVDLSSGWSKAKGGGLNIENPWAGVKSDDLDIGKYISSRRGPSFGWKDIKKGEGGFWKW